MPPKKNAGKKNKDDDWDDDAAARNLAKLKLSDEIKAEEVEWDDDSEDEAPPPPKTKSKTAFAALMMDDGDDDSQSEKADSEVETEPVEVEEKVKAPQQEKKVIKEEEPKDKKGKKKGKKNAVNKEEDDDLDAILASLDKPLEKPEPKGKKKVGSSSRDGLITPKWGKKEKSESPAEEKATDVVADAVETPKDLPGESVAAAEAEEGEKKKKKKKKDKKKGDGDDAVVQAAKETTEKDEDAQEKGDEEDEGDGEDKDKKKKKKKKDKKKKEAEDGEAGEKKGKKGKQISLIKEMLRIKQEAEEKERLRVEEEEKRIAEEEAKRAAEAEELAKRKEIERQRKKEAIDKKKAEGTYMTKAQMEKKRIAEEKLKAAGIVLPSSTETAGSDEKKPVKYLDKRALKKKQERERKLAEAAGEVPAPATPAVEHKEESVSAQESREETPEVSQAATPEEEEALDDWEMANVPIVPVDKPKVDKKEVKQITKKEDKHTTNKENGNVLASRQISQEVSSDEESSSDEDDTDESSSEESSDDSDGGTGRETKEQRMERVRLRMKKRREVNQAKRSVDELRAPVICVLGHVDTGKTKMLDTIRRTNVQDGEAGGITQQIGATQVPREAIVERCRQVRDFVADQMKLPGFLIIDTPGHESFANLRSRGSSLCDFAILVVDIMHGLEPQTIESLQLLLKRKTPFVIALNKIDRLYCYESNPRKDVYQHLKSQPTNTQNEFKERYNSIVGQFAEQGLNVALSNQNKDASEYVCMVPTSAYLGDGIGNLMSYIVNTTQATHAERLSFCDELDATVMEVKSIPGLGTTIDVILVNGRLRRGDVIVLTGIEGAITAEVRDLLMPQPLKELRVKNEYQHFDEIKGAQGVKVLAKGLEKSLAGLPVFVAGKEDELDVLIEEAEAQLSRALMSIKKKPEGVYVQASTLGSLEALLEFLKSQKIPYSNVNIGPVHKKDVQKAAAMREHNEEYACILAFDVKIERDAQQFADKEGVTIFQADIIYHLQDQFIGYREQRYQEARKAHEHLAIFPCRLRILPQHVFNARNPIVCGVVIENGQVKRGTPLCVPSKEGIMLGTVSSIQRNHEEVPVAKKGEEVCIRIENTTGDAPRLYGRHFNHEDILVSKINRESIDTCKKYFRDDLTQTDWQLIVQLKKLLDIL